MNERSSLEKERRERYTEEENGKDNKNTKDQTSWKEMTWREICSKYYVLFLVWLEKPLNKLMFIWLILVIISGAILFMFLVGMMKGRVTDEHEEAIWIEASSQVLNALFTIKALAVQPARAKELWRWFNRKPTVNLAPNLSRKDALITILLLNLNVWAQYVMCFFMWRYRPKELPSDPRPERSPIGVPLALCTSFIAEPLGIWYGKKYKLDEVESACNDGENMEYELHKNENVDSNQNNNIKIDVEDESVSKVEGGDMNTFKPIIKR